MAKKGGQVQLQVEVTNDEDWEKLLEKEGLIIVDIFSEWCGPCSAMSGNLKKIKLEVGGDVLQLAMAKCNNITDLARFRDKSEPTWMFIAGGQMVNLLFGANSPKLQQVLMDELKKEQEVKDGTRQREGHEITSLSAEEQAKFDEIEERKLEKAAKEKAAKEKAKAERLEVITDAIKETPQQRYGFVLVFPYAHDRLDQLSEIWQHFKQAGSEKVLLKSVNIDDLLYYSEYKFAPEVLEKSEGATCTAYLIKNEDPDVDIDEDLPQIVYGDSKAPPGSPESLAERLSTVYEPPEPPPGEEGAEKAEETDDEDQQIMMDGIWVPENERTRHMAMFVFFPNVVGAHVPPEPEPIPPHIAMVYDVWKQNDVLLTVEDNQSDVMHLGYFTDERPEFARLICKTPQAYLTTRRPADQENKLVVQVSKKHSTAVLAFAQIGPTYMSMNSEIGEEDCNKFFPEGYGDDEDTSVLVGVHKEDGEPFVEGLAAGDEIDERLEDEYGEDWEYMEDEEGEGLYEEELTNTDTSSLLDLGPPPPAPPPPAAEAPPAEAAA